MQIEHWKLGSYANNLIRLGRIMEYPEGTHRDHGAQALTLHRPPAHGDPTDPQGVTCAPSATALEGLLPAPGRTSQWEHPDPPAPSAQGLPACSVPASSSTAPPSPWPSGSPTSFGNV